MVLQADVETNNGEEIRMTTETKVGASEHDRAVSELATHLAWVIRVQIGDDPDHSGPEEAAEKLAAAMVEQAENILLTGDWQNLARPVTKRPVHNRLTDEIGAAQFPR